MSREEVRTKASMLLTKFGEYYDPSAYYINGTEQPYVLHKGYGLELRKMWRTDEYLIFYNGATVFDDIAHTYAPGEWEDVLEEYYNKIPKILEKQKKDKERTKRCEEIYNYLKSYLGLGNSYHGKNEKVYLGNNLTLTRTYGLAPYSTTYRSVDLKLYVGDNEVYCCRKEETNNGHDWNDDVISYPTYIPGKWETKIEEDYKERKLEQQKVKHLNNLNALRSL